MKNIRTKLKSITVTDGITGKDVEILVGEHYRVIKTSENYPILNDRFMLMYDRKDDQVFGPFNLFSSPRKTDKPFIGMSAMNHVKYFKTIDEVRNILQGVALRLDTEWATKTINNLQSQIDKIREVYNV